MKRTILSLALLAAAAPALAGVVYHVETTDHSSSPPEVMTGTMSAQGSSLRMQIASKNKGLTEIIFRNKVEHRGDPHENLGGKSASGTGAEVLMVDHDTKTYTVMDEATLKELAAQMNQAMAAMEQALAAVPEGQRKKMEEMMRAHMPMQAGPSHPSELRKTGDTDTVNGYPCTRYEVWRGGVRESELWVTGWSNVEGGDEVVEAFEGMAAFFAELIEAMPDFLGAKSSADASMKHMTEMKGFPVVTRTFGDSGALEMETALTSSESVSLEPATFEPPAGYARQDMMQGMKGKGKKK
jgi:hypothetical protein